jgi:hypothetical protein
MASRTRSTKTETIAAAAAPAAPVAPVVSAETLAAFAAFMAQQGALHVVPAPAAPAAPAVAAPVAPAAPVLPALRLDYLKGHIGGLAGHVESLLLEASKHAKATAAAKADKASKDDAFSKKCDAFMAKVWPKGTPCAPATWSAFRKDLWRYDADGVLTTCTIQDAMKHGTTYPAKCMAESYARIHGAIPQAAPRSEVRQGDGPKKIARGIGRSCDDLLAQARRLKACAKDVEPATLAAFLAAVCAMVTAHNALVASVQPAGAVQLDASPIAAPVLKAA